ncbi:TPA: hypothetical protein G9F11_005163 [Salmonella enterica]|uniref:Bro-N domain-containing protein n=1 Tax=Salmonella enterica TaxID=28901 RepID=A0A750HR47_SALER|nr:hypothetical protein [Salmonella enterica]HAG5257527.1 hypothetical protein [Salmonella enterica]
MTTQLTHFYFRHSSVRIQVIDGEPWFCLSDVAKILEIKNSRDLLSKQLDKDGVDKIYIIDSLSRKQEAAFINEPNLYRVIFRSNKPEARQFQDWVFNEVLPTIRKTGHYHHPVATSLTKPLPVFIVTQGAQNTSKAVSTPDSHVVFLCPEFLVYDRACG